MKKWISVFMALLLLVILAIFSGTETQDQNLPVLTIALRDGIYSDVITRSVKVFEEKEQIKCKIVELSEDALHSQIAEDTVLNKGEFDLCMVDGSWMAEYTHDGVLASLSDLNYELDDDIIPAAKEICYADGELYLAPYFGNVTVLLYNKLIVERTGHSKSELESLSDMMKICEDAVGRGHLGFMYRGDTANNYVVDFLPILSSFGGWVVDKDNNPTVNTPEFREAMEFYLRLIDTGKSEPRDKLVVAIANNAAAMAVGWPGWYTPDSKSTADYCAFTGKSYPDSEPHNANVYGIWTLGIPVNSTKKQLAEKLLAYLMDPEVQRKTVFYGGVPCRYSSLKDETVLEKYPEYRAVCDALENGVYRPIMVEWKSFYEILGPEMEQIIKGEKGIEEGLSEAQEKLEKMLLEHETS